MILFHILQVRRRVTVNTDPQRRVYNGCYYSSMEVWTQWEELCSYKDRIVAEETMMAFQKANPAREYQITESGGSNNGLIR